MKQNVRLISLTPDAENIMIYCARVSNPKKQDNKDTQLLKYCADKGHWSIFEMANMILEITTSRLIGRQILRHSFKFQEFSQRYANISELGLEQEDNYMEFRARRQDKSNRQNSVDDMDKSVIDWFNDKQRYIYNISNILYQEALYKGIAKEQARSILPQNISTRMYVNGTIRNWITYLKQRLSGSGSQKEHIEIAEMIRYIIRDNLPIVSEAFDI